MMNPLVFVHALIAGAGLVFLLGFSIAGMGVIISSGYRFALEVGLD
jgi:hypothetical protein